MFSNPQPSTAPRSGSPALAGWLVLLAAMYAALGWLCLGFEQPASRSRALGAQVLGPGESARLAAPSGSAGRWQLVVHASGAGAGQALALAQSPGSPPAWPRDSEAGRLFFAPILASRPTLANKGTATVTISQAWWKNWAAHNAGWPRFAVIWPPLPDRRVNWFLLAFTGLAVLWLQIAGLRCLGRPLQARQAWPLLVAPALGLVAALALYTTGLRLVLLWDALLLLAGLGPAGLWVPRAARALRQAWSAPAPWWKKALPAGAVLGLLLALAGGAVLALPTPPAKEPFDAALVKRLHKARPAYIIMGNSMAGSRIDAALLGRLAGARVYDLHRNQSYSTTWYLLLKNVVIPSGVKPRAVFLLFRDAWLTNPWRGAAGRNSQVAQQRYSLEREPLVERLVQGRGSWRGQIAQALEPLLLLEKYGPGLRVAMSQGAMDLARPTAMTTGYKLDQRRRVWERTVNNRFRLAGLRPHTAGFRARRLAQDLDFSRSLAGSFLPAMITLAQEHGIRLVLVRVQTRPRPDGQIKQSADLKSYIQQLGQYLRGQGVGFHDFTGDPAVSRAMYGNRDHIAAEHKADYTRLFHQRLGRFFD